MQMVTFTLSSQWPVIAGLWFFLGLAYAYLVRTLNDHTRYGRYWSQYAWLEVAGGNTLVAAAVWSVTGCAEVFAIVMVGNAVLGSSQIVLAVWSHIRAQGKADDEQATQEA